MQNKFKLGDKVKINDLFFSTHKHYDKYKNIVGTIIRAYMFCCSVDFGKDIQQIFLENIYLSIIKADKDKICKKRNKKRNK